MSESAMILTDDAYSRGLPASLDDERYILGAVLLDPNAYITVSGVLQVEDFSIEANRRIWERMGELWEKGLRLDRVTVAEELRKKNQLESVGGLSYLLSLDDGLPQIFNLESYVRIVKQKSLLRRIILNSQALINKAFAAEEDPEALLAEAEENLLKLGDSQSRNNSLQTPGEIIGSYEGGINVFLDPSKRKHGLSTGYVKLDEMTGGLREGELIILAARPAMGKTALALNIAQNVATNSRNAQTCAVFSLEMSKESLLTRLLCADARVDQKRFRIGYLDAEERLRLMQSASKFQDAPLYIDDSAAANLMEIHSKLRRLQKERGLGLVVIDYLQLMSSHKRVENRVQEVSQLSRGLKLLAKELRIPFIVLSQLSRAPEQRQGDHRPQLSDLRESGSIEQDADMVWFVFREEYYKREVESLKGLAELIVSKQRNGPTGKVDLYFRHEFTRFENRTSDLDEPRAPGMMGDTGYQA